jgi:ankyrin repeat protein
MRDEKVEIKGAYVELVRAAKGGDVSGMQRALGQGVRLDEQDEMGNSALMWAAGYGQVEAVGWLLEQGAKHDLMDLGGGQALDWCTCAQEPLDARQCVKLLIAAGADVMALDRTGWCALMHAANLSNKAVCKELMESMPESELLSWLPSCVERAKMRGAMELSEGLESAWVSLKERKELREISKEGKDRVTSKWI